MTVQTTKDVTQLTPITFTTDAPHVAAAAYDKLLALLAALDADDWSATTDCPSWTVRDMVGHMIGAASATSSRRELARQQLWAMRHKRDFGGNDLDAMNALQVRDTADLADSERPAMLQQLAPRAVAARMRFPRPLRRIRVRLAQGGSTAAGMPRVLTLGHLMAVIYTRDVWLHRIDIARATGHDLELDEVDARIVEDVVREWATRHGKPFELNLTGPAGGSFRTQETGDVLQLDAIEFCRVLSGRAPGDGLLATRVLF